MNCCHCSYIERCHADFILLAATVALLKKSSGHQLAVGPPVILLLLVDSCLVLAAMEVVRLFSLRPLPGYLK